MIEYKKTAEGIEKWHKTLMEVIPYEEWEKRIAQQEKTITDFDKKKYLDELQASVDGLKAIHNKK